MNGPSKTRRDEFFAKIPCTRVNSAFGFLFGQLEMAEELGDKSAGRMLSALEQFLARDVLPEPPAPPK